MFIETIKFNEVFGSQYIYKCIIYINVYKYVYVYSTPKRSTSRILPKSWSIKKIQADAKGKKKEETKAAPKVDAKVDEAWQMCSRCASVTLVSYLQGGAPVR